MIHYICLVVGSVNVFLTSHLKKKKAISNVLWCVDMFVDAMMKVSIHNVGAADSVKLKC